METRVIHKHAPLFVYDDWRTARLWGGRGSGKSWAAAMLCARLLVAEKKSGLFVRKYQRTIRASQYTLFDGTLSRMGLAGQVRSLRGSLGFETPAASIISVGVDDPEKIKSVEGISFVWFEEATELAERDFDTIFYSLRDDDIKVILTHNPMPSKTHWLRRRKFDIDIHSTYQDNPHLPARFVQSIEELEQKDPTLWTLWGRGEWAEIEGAIYRNYEMIGAVPDDAELVCYGLDFGYSSSSTALVACYRYNDTWIADEVIYSTGLDIPETMALMERKEVSKVVPIHADRSAPASIATLRNNGFACIASEAGTVYDSVMFCASLKLQITGHSSNLQDEIAMYRWSVDKHGEAMPVPVKEHDHGMDAMRYGLFGAEKHVPFRIIG